jgi:hypothetical protein
LKEVRVESATLREKVVIDGGASDVVVTSTAEISVNQVLVSLVASVVKVTQVVVSAVISVVAVVKGVVSAEVSVVGPEVASELASELV